MYTILYIVLILTQTDVTQTYSQNESIKDLIYKIGELSSDGLGISDIQSYNDVITWMSGDFYNIGSLKNLTSNST